MNGIAGCQCQRLGSGVSQLQRMHRPTSRRCRTGVTSGVSQWMVKSFEAFTAFSPQEIYDSASLFYTKPQG